MAQLLYLPIIAVLKRKLKKIFYLGDEKPAQTGSCLLIRAGKHHFGYATAAPGANTLERVAYYGESDPNAESLRQIISSDPIFDESFSKIMIGYDFDRSLLLPSGLYRADSSSQLVGLVYGKNGRSENLKDFIPSWQIYNLYEVPSEIHSFLKDKFQSAIFLHQHSVEILNCTALAGGHFTINIRSGECSILAMQNGSLILAQSYEYADPIDMIYYLLKICEQSGLSPKEVNIRVSGLIEENSSLSEELNQYFMNVGFRAANGSQGIEHPAHFFTSFNDLLKCV